MTYLSKNEPTKDPSDKTYDVLTPIFGMFCVMTVAGMCVFGYQASHWIAHGHWQPLSVRVLLDKIMPDFFWLWLSDDTTWMAFKSVIEGVANGSLGFSLIIYPSCLFFFIAIVKLKASTQ